MDPNCSFSLRLAHRLMYGFEISSGAEEVCGGGGEETGGICSGWGCLRSG